jgi:UDP-glucose 6-dehydrogenase
MRIEIFGSGYVRSATTVLFFVPAHEVIGGGANADKDDRLDWDAAAVAEPGPTELIRDSVANRGVRFRPTPESVGTDNDPS